MGFLGQWRLLSFLQLAKTNIESFLPTWDILLGFSKTKKPWKPRHQFYSEECWLIPGCYFYVHFWLMLMEGKEHPSKKYCDDFLLCENWMINMNRHKEGISLFCFYTTLCPKLCTIFCDYTFFILTFNSNSYYANLKNRPRS